MTSFFSGLTTMTLLALLLACAKQGPPEPPSPAPAKSVEAISWTFAPLAIQIGVIADESLNAADDGSTGLALCLYQLEDPNQFLTLSKAKAGLLNLLACSTELKGAVGAERLYVQPGQKSDWRFDRLEKARYLAAVAGYWELKPQLAAAILPIPIEQSRAYFLFKRYSPMVLEAWLRLKAHNLALFPKSSNDLGRLAKDVTLEPQPGEAFKFPRPNSPTIATPSEKELVQAAEAAKVAPSPKFDHNDPWPKTPFNP